MWGRIRALVATEELELDAERGGIEVIGAVRDRGLVREASPWEQYRTKGR